VSPTDQIRSAVGKNVDVLSFSGHDCPTAAAEPIPARHGHPARSRQRRTGLTIGLDGLLVCRSGLDTDLYGVTKAFFQALPELSAFDAPPLRQMNPEDASATPIPLHEGAARYYREQGAM
jgi:hypothetical protein